MADNLTPPITLSTARTRNKTVISIVMLAAVVTLVAALWSGLAHLGLPINHGNTSLKNGHGPMMILGFLGTVISLERAVAVGRHWCYLAPVITALGGLLVPLGVPIAIPAILVTVGGIVLVVIYIHVHCIQPSLHNAVLTCGSLCWVVAGTLWSIGWPIDQLIPWLAAFLVLTISGERLELSRIGGVGRWGQRLFVCAAGFHLVGVAASTILFSTGVRIAGIGLIFLGVWMIHFDIARRTIKTHMLTRYIAAGLLVGYVWLVVAGVVWTLFGAVARTTEQPSAYDAMLHAIFLGYVISMIFAHAPIIVPAVLGRPLPYHPGFYLPLVLLHASVLVRIIGGDLFGNVGVWQWSGILNEVAILFFMAMAGVSLFALPRRSKRHRYQRSMA